MVITKHLPSVGYTVKYRITEGGPEYATSMISSSTNCKLAYVESGGALFNVAKTDEDRKAIIEEMKKLLQNRNLLFTLTEKTYADWLAKNYVCYYSVVVPVGYSQGNQYHVLVKNHTDSRAPIEQVKQVEVVKEKKVLPIKTITDIVEGAFAITKKRKERIEFITNKLEQVVLE